MNDPQVTRRGWAVGLLIGVVLLGASHAAAAEPVRDVLAAAGGGRYWTAVVTSDPANGDGRPVTSVRQRQAGSGEVWNEVGRFETRAVQIVDAGGLLILLDDQGVWRWVGGSASQTGPPLPDGARPVSIAFAPAGIYALGRIGTPAATTRSSADPTTRPGPAARKRLYLLRDGAWQRVADVTDDAASIAAVGDALYVLAPTPQRLLLRRLESNALVDAGTVESSSVDFALLTSQGRPVVWVRRADGTQAVCFPFAREKAVVPVTGPLVPGPAVATGAAIVDESLRLVYASKADLQEAAFWLDGKAVSDKPRSLAPATLLTPAPRTWVDVLVLSLMTVAIIATLRQRPILSEADYDKLRARLATFPRRALAGAIDGLPVIGALAWAQATLEPGISMMAFRTDLSPLMWGGVAVYVLHTMAAELLTGKSAGKWACGLRVERIDGSKPAAWDIVLRNLLRVIDVLGIALLFVFFSPFRQRIGDAAARTVVIREAADGSATPPPNPPLNPPGAAG